MRYNLYCDESSISSARYMLIGGLWVPWETEATLKAMLSAVRATRKLRAEMKWTKVSHKMLPAYRDFVDMFFSEDTLSFKCIVLDTHVLDHQTYHRGDKELGFYKFYFQVVSRNLLAGNLYWLYTDERKNRKPYRLEVLKLTVNRWWNKQAGVQPLRAVEPRRSHDEDILQLADILLGAIAYAWNGRRNSPAKLALIEHIAHRLGWPTLRLATRPTAPKVNIWKWEPVVR
ncbi:MAG: DUF3800 domain-containing protein [Chloroflexota bacterium]